jgi:hypothetical protein
MATDKQIIDTFEKMEEEMAPNRGFASYIYIVGKVAKKHDVTEEEVRDVMRRYWLNAGAG